MKTNNIDYETDLPEDQAEEVFAKYLKNTDARTRALHPDYSYFVSSRDGVYTVLESVDSNDETLYNLAEIKDRRVKEERISWKKANQIMSD